MEGNKLVSVIVPIYKVEKYLEKCINSIISQTYTNLEIILVDDGSPDNCGKICESFKNKDSRIKVIHKENQGLGMARNSGLEIATGDYVVFVDSDDWIDNNMIELMLLRSINENADIVVCGYKKCNEEKELQKVKTTDKLRIFDNKDDIIKYAVCPILGQDEIGENYKSRSMSVWINMYSMPLLKNNSLQFVSERIYLTEDLFFNLKALLYSNKIVFMPECLYSYRYNPVSLSNGYRANKVELMQTMYNELYNILEKENLVPFIGKRVERSYIMRLRHALMIFLEGPISQKEKKEKFKNAFEYPLTKRIISNYPMKKVPVKEKIMVFLMKQNSVWGLMFYLRLQIFLIGIRNNIKSK